MRKTLAAFALSAGVLVAGPAIAQAQTVQTPAPSPTAASSPTDSITPYGWTCVQWNCSGQLSILIQNRTSNQSFTFNTGFTNRFVGVNNPRLQVRMLGFQGQVIAEENRYWSGNLQNGDFIKGQSYMSPVATVCVTLWEGGIQLGTACENV